MASSKSKVRPRMTREQLKAYLEKNPQAQTPELKEVLDLWANNSSRPTRDSSFTTHPSSGSPVSSPANNALSAALISLGLSSSKEKSAPKKRRGIEVKPIVDSLKNAFTSVSFTQDEGRPVLSLWFESARILTVNELFSIFQFRKHEVFQYKKAWRLLMKRALSSLSSETRDKIWFDSPTRLTLFRRGKGEVDIDSLSTVFKYATDSLRTEGIIDDDNPNIIADIKLLQGVGSPALGMRLEALEAWTPVDTTHLFHEWFESSEEKQKV